jgi:sulfite reductase beta subunit-like hemoprotein
MGRRPATGIELYESIPVDQLLPLVVASLRFFNDEGNRKLRYSARFRHVRERMGDEAFRARLNGEFDRALQEDRWPTPQVSPVSSGKEPKAHINFPFGDISGHKARQIARMAEEADAAIRLGFTHNLLLFSNDSLELDPKLEALGKGPTVVACPGTTWCQRGLADSRGTERRIRELWPHGVNLSIGISGCPNNCAHAGVADIGLTGRIKKIDGKRTPCFRLFAGGGNGKNAGLGLLLHPVVPEEEVPGITSLIAKKYRGEEDGSFRNFIEKHQESLVAEIEQRITEASGTYLV